ncbi:MAG TPA: patatin-like phospholipase family protein [Candidatus Krumholzibacteria bacterium]|nr:patatin-like phospholipase family protein [Candidatus Krumholzibacteria bacterium]
MIRVLSIDGGGIRGIIPAMVLAEIERRTGRRIAELFDIIAGTSTGGILALGLTRPGPGAAPSYTAEALIELYVTEGSKIFSRSRWHRLRSLGNLVEEKYPARGIEAVLGQYFGATRLKEALTEVVITSYEIERRTAWFFRSRKARLRPDYDFPMKHVARATSAAPTYFEPMRIASPDGDNYYALIDGGVFANNPALCGYVEARCTYPDADDFLVVSLGTGELTRSLPYEEVKGWGVVRWAHPILSVVFDGINDTIDYQLQQLLPRGPDGRRRYYRLQTRLEPGIDDMDQTDRAHLHALRLLGENLIRERDEDLGSLCRQLVAATPQSKPEPQTVAQTASVQ